MTNSFDYEGDLIVFAYLSVAWRLCECVGLEENGPERRENSALLRYKDYLKNFP